MIKMLDVKGENPNTFNLRKEKLRF